MFGKSQERGKQGSATKQKTLHSIAAMQRARGFEGSFEVANVKYSFSYLPKRAALNANKLQLVGTFNVSGPGERSSRNLNDVKATLLAIQGGIGTPPQREKMPSDVSTLHPDLPIVESTGSISFSGALFFKLSSIDSRALGVSTDMSKVQLNVRLAPVSDTERALQAAFSSIADSLYGQQIDSKWAESAVSELNKLLSAN